MNSLHNPINKKPESFVPILLNHCGKYPLMKIQDIYKLIYQAAMGPEHIIENKEISYKRLCVEFEEVDLDSNRPLLEEIDPANQIVRLYINPFKARGFELKKLFDAFYRTAASYTASPRNLERYFNEIFLIEEKKILPVNINDLKGYFFFNQKRNFPPVHHSDTYKSAYHPSYRLVLKKYLNFLCN